MFQEKIWLPVLDAIAGISYISRLQNLTELSRPTARKYLEGKVSLSKRRKVDAKAEENVIKGMVGEGVSEEEARSWLEAHPAYSAVSPAFQSVVYGYLGAENYPLLDMMAEKIDRAMSALFSACRENGIEHIEEAIAKLEGFSPDYMVSHDRKRLNKVDDRYDGKKNMEIFLRNACLSFFALLDLECMSRDYPEHELSPIFINLTPRVSAQLRLGEKCARGGMVLPFSSLMDLMGLLADRGKVGYWRDVPSVDNIARMANMSASEVAKIRHGDKRLSLKQFSSMWKEMVQPIKSTRPELGRLPVELYLAAVFFQVTFCGKAPSKWIDVVGHEYRYWWEHHRNVLEATPGYQKGEKSLPQWFLQNEF